MPPKSGEFGSLPARDVASRPAGSSRRRRAGRSAASTTVPVREHGVDRTLGGDQRAGGARGGDDQRHHERPRRRRRRADGSADVGAHRCPRRGRMDTAIPGTDTRLRTLPVRSPVRQVHHVAGVDAVGDAALVEHDQPSVGLDVDGAALDQRRSAARRAPARRASRGSPRYAACTSAGSASNATSSSRQHVERVDRRSPSRAPPSGAHPTFIPMPTTT